MGLHFIFSGAAHDQPGLIATLQENPIQLEKVATSWAAAPHQAQFSTTTDPT